MSAAAELSLAGTVSGSAAANAIKNAIRSADHKMRGVVFNPFHVIVASGRFSNIWNNDRGDNAVTFFQFTGGGDFLPLGDMAMPVCFDSRAVPTAPGAQMLFGRAGGSDALANPLGFERVLDDSGSKNGRDLAYWRMKPPAGYVALGICFTNGGEPARENYWCVKETCTRIVSRTDFWSDSGQRWHSNGNLQTPAFGDPSPAVPDGSMLLIPPTFLSGQDRDKETAYALAVEGANLELAIPAPEPVFNPSIGDGDTTAAGVLSVKVVPYTAVTGDQNYPNQSINSPFYYVAAQPYWYCKEVVPTPGGGSVTRTTTIGTSETQSQKMMHGTSLTLSASVGVEYGAGSASVSTSFTEEFQLTTESSATHSSEVTASETIQFVPQPITWIWEHRLRVSVYRADQTQVASAAYANRNRRFVPPGAKVLSR
jgi:hypothetical protein